MQAAGFHYTHYDRLNPRCAEICHAVIDKMGPIFKLPRSHEIFEKADVRAGLDADFERGRSEIATFGEEKAIDNILYLFMTNIIDVGELQPENVQNLWGSASALSHLRRLIFGIAPGMAHAMKIDPYIVTIALAKSLATTYADHGGEAATGAANIWSPFHDLCIEFVGPA
jgi:hypothetical protein